MLGGCWVAALFCLCFDLVVVVGCGGDCCVSESLADVAGGVVDGGVGGG